MPVSLYWFLFRILLYWVSSLQKWRRYFDSSRREHSFQIAVWTRQIALIALLLWDYWFLKWSSILYVISLSTLRLCHTLNGWIELKRRHRGHARLGWGFWAADLSWVLCKKILTHFFTPFLIICIRWRRSANILRYCVHLAKNFVGTSLRILILQWGHNIQNTLTISNDCLTVLEWWLLQREDLQLGRLSRLDSRGLTQNV